MVIYKTGLGNRDAVCSVLLMMGERIFASGNERFVSWRSSKVEITYERIGIILSKGGDPACRCHTNGDGEDCISTMEMVKTVSVLH
jgi:hypothetical protein